MKQNEPRKTPIPLPRLVVVYSLVLVWSLVLVGRLIQLQVFREDEYRQRAEDQHIGTQELGAKRGEILDRRLGELAISIRVESLSADPKLIQDPEEVARCLAPILTQPYDHLYRKLTSDRRFVYLQRKLPPQQAEKIRELNLTGVFFNEETQRVYPSKELAAHVLGFVGMDNEGLSGLEYYYNGEMEGQKGRASFQFDARRKSYQRVLQSQPSDGNILVLNLDRTIQFTAEQVLQERVRSTGALNGSAIVMDPHRGEILAMASYPAFNPNRYSDYESEHYRNRAILEIFEPGSIFKVVTLSAVLNEGLSDLDEPIDCRVGTLRLAGKVYREAKRSFGELTLEEIVAKSSNVGTIKLGLRLGPERLHRYIRAFGFGEKSGVDLPGEQMGLLRPPAQWSKISIGAVSIGQEIGVTPLQMLRAVSAVANGGHLVRPRVVRQILSSQNDLIAKFKPERRRILDPETAEKMKQALARVVEAGTGSAARLEGYASAGKTGTAQKYIGGRYSRSKYVASFVGFAPLENPALAAIVVINEPRKGYYGGSVAAPAFKAIMEQALAYLQVPPETPPRHDLAQGRPTGELSEDVGVSVTEDEIPRAHLEKTVLRLIEEKTAAQDSMHVVTLHSSLRPVPDFSGLSLRRVARQCAQVGLVLKFSGSGRAVGQRPEAGSRVAPGTVCEVFFSPQGHN